MKGGNIENRGNQKLLMKYWKQVHESIFWYIYFPLSSHRRKPLYLILVVREKELNHEPYIIYMNNELLLFLPFSMQKNQFQNLTLFRHLPPYIKHTQ